MYLIDFKKFIKNKLLFLMFNSLLINSLFAQKFEIFNTADCLKKDEVSIGTFSKSAIGMNYNIQLSSNVINNLLSPNFGIKKIWFNREIIISTEHIINYPKLALLACQYTSFYNWISDTTVISKTLLLTNKIYLSRYFQRCRCCWRTYLITFKIGITNNIPKNDSLFFAINHPLLYHRTQIFNNSVLWNFGIDFQANINEKMNFISSLDNYLIFKHNVYAIESKLLVNYLYSENWIFLAGIKIAYNFANINKHFFVFPVIDAHYFFKIPRKPKEGLFEKQIKKFEK